MVKKYCKSCELAQGTTRKNEMYCRLRKMVVYKDDSCDLSPNRTKTTTTNKPDVIYIVRTINENPNIGRDQINKFGDLGEAQAFVRDIAKKYGYRPKIYTKEVK
jgi:hypothetical protein